MSDEVERKLVALLHDPTEDPHGNPIPALEELGAAPAIRPRYTLHTLAATAAQANGPEGIPIVVRRISENLQQSPELMKELRIGGLLPGRIVRVTALGQGGVRIVAEDGTPAEFDDFVALHVFVSVI